MSVHHAAAVRKQCLPAGIMMTAFAVCGFYLSIGELSDYFYARTHRHVDARIVSSEKVKTGKFYSMVGVIEFDRQQKGVPPCHVVADFGENDLILPGLAVEIVPRGDWCADPILSFRFPIGEFILEGVGFMAGAICLAFGLRGNAGFAGQHRDLRS